MPGFNPKHGYDTGPPPPGFPPQAAVPPQFGYAPAGWTPGFPTPNVAQAAVFIQPPPPNIIYQPPVFPPHPPYNFPANNIGGVSSGYSYIFPQENTRIHVFTTSTPPWQQRGSMSHVKLVIPCNTTVKDLMVNLGCTNPDPKKNILYEITEGGNGKWYRGLTFSGNDKDKIKKQIAEYGWNKSRTGKSGERPVVWVWCTKG